MYKIKSRNTQFFSIKSLAQFSLSSITALMFCNLVQAQSLPQLIELAMTSNPSIKSFNAYSTASKYAIDTTKQAYFPTIAIEGEHAFTQSSSPSYQGDDHQITLSITQPLWTGGKLKANLDRARAFSASSAAELEQSKQDITLKIIQSYGNWQGAYFKRKAWQKSLATHQHLRTQVNRRVKLGLSAKSERALVNGRLASAQAELSAIQVQEQISLSRLSQLVGNTFTSSDLSTQSAMAIDIQSSQAELLLSAEKFSPSVENARTKLNVSRAEIAAKKAQYMPEISMRYELQYGNYSHKNAEVDNRFFVNFKSQFGPGLSMITNLREAQTLREGARQEVAMEQNALEEQIMIDYVIAQSFAARIKALKRSKTTAISVTQSYQRQYLAGQKKWLDVLNSARDLVNSELQLADAQAANLVVTWRMAILTKGLQGYMTDTL